jgi:hypothetical protein
MIDFVGFSDGYRKQQDTGERKRLELAKAFQEFQRQNPTANPLEFQAFIDSMAGGSNYLRGGMPSGDMLKAITDRADTRRAQADADRERSILEKNIQLQTSLEGAATGIMLGYKDPSEGGYELKDFNEMTNQLKERFPGVDFDKIGFDPTTMFTGDRRRSAIAARVAEYLPTITNLVQSSGGQGITAEKLSGMGVPPALIKPLITQANQLETERRDVFARTRGLEISREAQEQIALGNKEVYAHLVRTFGSENLPKKDSPLMKQYIADATTAANEAKNNRERATLKLGRDLTNDMMANDGLRSSLFLDDRAETEQAMLDFAKSEMTDADFEAVFRKKKADAQASDMSGYVDNMIASLSVVQRKEITEARQGAKGQVVDLVNNAKATNDAAVINRFGDPSKKDAPPQVGNGGRSAQLAAQSLAKKYAMTPSVLQAMENVFASIPADEPQTMTSIMSFVEADPAFQNAAQGNLLKDVLGRLEDDANNKYGRRNQQTYGEWFADTQSRVDSTMSSYTDKVSTATAMFQDDPVKLVQALQAVASNLNASMEDAISDWRAAEQTSKDFTGWRTPGSEAFDSSAVFGDASGSLEKTMRLQGSEVLSEIDLLIQDAKQRILAEQSSTETGDGPLAQDEQVDAVQDLESFMQDLDDQQKLMKIQDEFGKQGAPASWLLGLLGFNDYTEMDRVKGKAISQFLQTPRVKNALKEDRENFNAFLEDPVVFMLESDAPYVVNWFNSDLGSTYAELIGRQ